MLKIKVILGSIRENRFGEQPAKWITEKAKQKGLDVELLDLRDYPLPMFAEPAVPASLKGNYTNEIAKKWAAKIGEADGFIFTVAEYNHGYTSVLKNAIDFIYDEWLKKPVAFLGYGANGGVRAVEQLKQVVNSNLQMQPVAAGVIISEFWNHLDEQGKLKTEPFEKSADGMIDQLIWLGNAMKAARDADVKAAAATAQPAA
jgi:NAD(P)H-dependent FMN reductase